MNLPFHLFNDDAFPLFFGLTVLKGMLQGLKPGLALKINLKNGLEIYPASQRNKFGVKGIEFLLELDVVFQLDLEIVLLLVLAAVADRTSHAREP